MGSFGEATERQARLPSMKLLADTPCVSSRQPPQESARRSSNFTCSSSNRLLPELLNYSFLGVQRVALAGRTASKEKN